MTEIKAGEQGVDAVTLEDTGTGAQRDMPIDGVFVFIGFVPNNQLVPAGIRLNADGFVITDDTCRTNLTGIYVVGDLRERYARQIVLAAGDGCLAALACAHYVETRKASQEVCELPASLRE